LLRVAAVLASGCATAVPASAPLLQLHPGVQADRAARAVSVQGRVACRRGYLEQVACGRGSREHESLIVIDAPATAVHAALLAIGLQPGAPGEWHQAADGSLSVQPPAGPSLQVLVQPRGAAEPVPVQAWLRDLRGGAAPTPRFVFAGSRLVPGRSGERYLADESGSVIGLVTFGDEVVALQEVLPDRVAVQPAHFQARTEAMPDEGTPVTLWLRAGP
jgi:hypothetical protein